LPGLWLRSEEIYALLTMRQLIGGLSPGLLSAQLEPLLLKMHLLLDGEQVFMEAFEKRIRIHRLNARGVESTHFIPVASAVLKRKRLIITHHNKMRNETVTRTISPQRLTHYRENWYVDAWCHLRNELRSFGLSALREVQSSETAALEVPDDELGKVLDAGYGIFSGRQVQWAELVFSIERARWVSLETWHAEQESWFDEAGRYHLRFPYSDPREVSMDILRHVPEVTIVAPDALRSSVLALLDDALKRI